LPLDLIRKRQDREGFPPRVEWSTEEAGLLARRHDETISRSIAESLERRTTASECGQKRRKPVVVDE
jgi:hypothetical protein